MLLRSPRGGFTLVELLVCIGIIGLLLSLLLAGIQSARESARRMQCLNNIRQIALACQEFEAAHGSFPRTVNGIDGNRGGISESLSPHVQLLPYLDQVALFDSIDLSEPARSTGEPPTSSLNPQALEVFVPVFVCPSDDLATGGATNYRACMGIGPGIHGNATWEYGNGSGAWKAWRKVRTAEITDGLSNTVLFGEKLTGDRDPDRYTPWRDVADMPVPGGLKTIAQAETVCARVGRTPKHLSYGGAAWLLGGYEQSWYNHLLAPNSPTPDCGYVYGAYSARSFHPVGVNVSLVDGSARFISDGIDLSIWRAMSTRRRGEVVAGF